ncbi:MAG TPA: tRNA 2-thiouridine(34) synthase MnmA [Acidimicrobiales bacterium]|nr:tRNA 2-thiouridine(34) synthase MnmA [Acidimicrobiales bacterium]
MRVLVAMSGGVDSSVAAALLLEQGHDVVGATMKLWGGPSDSGCCSVADVEDARRVAQQLDIAHHVFNFADDFDLRVVEPYVAAHVAGRTPNPCIECNRHLKFDRFLERAATLGFDAIATGHHARVVERPDGSRRVARAADRRKDQSYVLYMLGRRALARTLLPVGALTKDEVRDRAHALGLRTAAKPDSQDVCFVTSTGGRAAFLGERIPLRPGRLVDVHTGDDVGRVPAVELVTVGQRRHLGSAGDGTRRYALAVEGTTVAVGSLEDLSVDRIPLVDCAWADAPPPLGTAVLAQWTAHGTPVAAVYEGDLVRFLEPQRRVAPGQSVVLYEGDEVLGGGIAA